MSLTKYAGIMVIVWVFCLDRIPECSNYGELANSLYLVRKQNKKKWTCPSSCWGAGLLSKYSCWWAWGHGAFEQHLVFLWLAVLAASWPGDQEGGTIRPWHRHLSVSARKQPFPLPCVLSPAGVRPRKGKGIGSLPLPSQERVCPCEAHWHTHTTQIPAVLLRGEGVRKGQASTPLGVEPSQQESLPLSLRRVSGANACLGGGLPCAQWRLVLMILTSCVYVQEKKNQRRCLPAPISRALSLSSALSLPLQTLDLNLLRIQHRGSSLG